MYFHKHSKMQLFFFSFLSATALADRILFLNPLGFKSHTIFYVGISEALTKRGHHVTMVSPNQPSKERQHITEVVIEDLDLDNILLTTVFEDTHSALKTLHTKSPQLCSDTLSQQQVQDLKREHFDIILLSMFFADCYLSFVHHFKVPFIYVSPLAMFTHFNGMINNVEFPSVVRNILNEPKFPMTFKERMENVLVGTTISAVNHYFNHIMESVCRERGLCLEDMPPFSEIRKNASLAIINYVRALEWPPRPMMPNIIYAGGAHVKPAKNLSKELEEWSSGTGDDGFILFSLGSTLRPSRMPQKYREILMKVFGSLNESVLMKWDGDSIPGLPKNVKLAKWLPQSDVLGHPKLKLFITHGGLLSSQEAIYNGVPIVGMPLFSDQFFNTHAAEREGWAKVMKWKELEEEAFRSVIVNAINDKNLRKEAKRRSILMRDIQIPPDEEAVFWVEYVMRHKGAHHMMSPMRIMAWYEIYNVDVYSFLLGIVLGLIYLLWLSMKFILRIVCGIFGAKKKKLD